VRISLH